MTISPAPEQVVLVDVHLLRHGRAGLEVLLLRRAEGGRSPGSWEGVHGHLWPGESVVAAARREVAEETGYQADRLYNLSRVEHFYLHRVNRIAVVPAFAVLAPEDHPVTLSVEHDRSEWLPLAEAIERVGWPRIRRALADAAVLLASGDAGPVEDVLRVEAPAD